MNQLKYLRQAFLLLFSFAFVLWLSGKLSSVDIVKRKPVTTSIEGKPNSTVVRNAEGHKLFSNHCATCHALDKTLTGPALRGFHERGPWTERMNTIAWVKNPAGTFEKFT